MSASPMADQTFIVPVSSGIFAHCARIGIAIWVFLWMIDRTTQERPDAGGYLEGFVYGGRPVRAQEIAKELQMGTRTVQAHLDHLVSAGYIRRLSGGHGVACGYAVRRSKKRKSKLSVVGGREAATDPAEFGEGAQESADTALISAGGAQKMAPGALNSAPYNRKDITHITQTVFVEDFTLDGEPVSSSSKKEKLISLVKTGWSYYLEQTKKASSQYQLTRDRERMGASGFEELIKFARRREHPDPWSAASDLFRVAVDRLASSPFHNGENDHHRKYLDWHQLFRAKEYPAPRKLLEFWLDDSRWPA